jgi:hypothetical protein
MIMTPAMASEASAPPPPAPPGYDADNVSAAATHDRELESRSIQRHTDVTAQTEVALATCVALSQRLDATKGDNAWSEARRKMPWPEAKLKLKAVMNNLEWFLTAHLVFLEMMMFSTE